MGSFLLDQVASYSFKLPFFSRRQLQAQQQASHQERISQPEPGQESRLPRIRIPFKSRRSSTGYSGSELISKQQKQKQQQLSEACTVLDYLDGRSRRGQALLPSRVPAGCTFSSPPGLPYASTGAPSAPTRSFVADLRESTGSTGSLHSAFSSDLADRLGLLRGPSSSFTSSTSTNVIADETPCVNRPSSCPDFLASLTATCLPPMLREYSLQVQPYDKVFSSHWLSMDTILLGTKCNKLLVVDLASGKRTEIPTILASSESTTSRRNSNQQELDALKPRGIHSIVENPSGTLLATGSARSETIAIYRVPELEPVAILPGHTDLVFSLQWLNDRTLVSGSRDHSIAVWNLPASIENASGSSQSPLLPSLPPRERKTEHSGKVRNMKWNSRTGQLMTLSSDTTVKLWDMNRMRVIDTIPLVRHQEAVCIDVDTSKNLYAIGSQSHITLLDPRTPTSVIHEAPSLDENQGVRSLAWNEHVVAVGGGKGRISFYDVRAQHYLELDLDHPGAEDPLINVPRKETPPRKPHHVSGAGWLHHDQMYMRHFYGLPIQNAIYSLQYDPSRTRLLATGGPLQMGLTGSYAAIWA